jgi:hypothetical protein
MRFKNEAQPGSDSAQSAFHETFGSLGGCMLDGDVAQAHHERLIRRWSLGISVALQTVLITAMVIAPLLAKTETISYRVTPIPPYAGQPKSPQHPARRPTQPPPPVHKLNFFNGIPPVIVTHDPRRDDNSPVDSVFDPNSTVPGGNGFIPVDDSRSGPKRPDVDREKGPVKRIRATNIEPAMLTKRVEPVYPVLGLQIRRAGRVELHAIISTDGSIKSLEVIDGDPLFVRSALDAVSQWHYQPTKLNGEPVEVDTHIAVIYSMPR